jgi:hypothetical protein
VQGAAAVCVCWQAVRSCGSLARPPPPPSSLCHLSNSFPRLPLCVQVCTAAYVRTGPEDPASSLSERCFVKLLDDTSFEPLASLELQDSEQPMALVTGECPGHSVLQAGHWDAGRGCVCWVNSVCMSVGRHSAMLAGLCVWVNSECVGVGIAGWVRCRVCCLDSWGGGVWCPALVVVRRLKVLRW